MSSASPLVPVSTRRRGSTVSRSPATARISRPPGRRRRRPRPPTGCRPCRTRRRTIGHLVEVGDGVVDDPFGPELHHQVSVGAAAHPGDAGAEAMGELHGVRADRTGRAVDEHTITGPDPCLAEKVQGGRAAEQHAGGILIADPIGDRHRLGGGHRNELRVGPHRDAGHPRARTPGAAPVALAPTDSTIPA